MVKGGRPLALLAKMLACPVEILNLAPEMSNFNKKFELMLTRRGKTYSSSGSVV